MRDRAITSLALLAVLFSASAARADEIRLKDGTKISGTIVGFENDSFRVETSYGFALVQKDKVADINISAPKKDSDPKAKSSAPPAPPSAAPLPPSPPPSAEPELAPAVEKESASAAKTPWNRKMRRNFRRKPCQKTGPSPFQAFPPPLQRATPSRPKQSPQPPRPPLLRPRLPRRQNLP